MLIKVSHPHPIMPSEITPEAVYDGRRRLSIADGPCHGKRSPRRLGLLAFRLPWAGVLFRAEAVRRAD